MRKNIVFFFLIFLVFSISADISQEFDFLHSASFSFRNNVPYIRVHVKSYENGTKIENIKSFECGSSEIVAKSFTFSVSKFSQAVVKYRIAFQELAQSELRSHAEKVKLWSMKTGMETEIFVHGAIFSINKSTIDNREYFITSKELFTKDESEKLLSKFRELFPDHNIVLIPVHESNASSTINVKTDDGKSYKCQNLLLIHPKAGFMAGNDSYPGDKNYFITPLAASKGELVIEDSVENILQRILPGEMFLSAPLETLKAQAVAARTDIFMQLGKRHVSEIWHICSEVHCQKVIWNGKVDSKFVQAVKETEGEVLLFNGTHVARAPYCSSAGGRTEDIRNVWFTAEKPYLSGVWDGDEPLDLDLSKEEDLAKFLQSDYGEDNIKMNKRHRWEVRFTQEKLNELVNSRKNIGNINKINALSRGVSGRIYKIEFVGNAGRLTVYGELNIRKLLDNLYSSAFLARKEGDEWIFSGMGWGHGVGMSQMGAVSLGRKGRDFRFILKRYYPKTEISKIY
ncbi:SpoIID/LytB domain-containing protein [bacterium]|nr:SpoIID/LytB domain-containing protein [bacterium]